jgi:hypothetical protein
MYRPSEQAVELEIPVREVALMQGHVARDADTAILKYARLDLDIIKRFGMATHTYRTNLSCMGGFAGRAHAQSNTKRNCCGWLFAILFHSARCLALL